MTPVGGSVIGKLKIYHEKKFQTFPFGWIFSGSTSHVMKDFLTIRK